MVIACTWKTDGSSECQQVNISDQPHEDDGFTKLEVTTTGGSPVNLMASSATSQSSSSSSSSSTLPDSYWYQVRIVDQGSSVSVGVVLPREFQAGWKNKGMFYNGNLTNGSAALKTSYGPHLKSGDTVVLECIHLSTSNNNNSSSTFAMTIYLNGKKIGRGFEIAIQDPAERFVPCLAVRGKVQLLVQITAQIPDLSALQISMHPLEGKWKIVDAKKDTTGNDRIIPVRDEAGNELPDQRDIIMDIAPSHQPSSIRIAVHVFNNISVQKGCTASLDQTIFDLSNIGVSPIMTMMMPPRPYDRVENELSKAMVDHWQSFRLQNEYDENDASKLTIATVNNHVMAHCVRLTNDMDAPALTKYHH